MSNQINEVFALTAHWAALQGATALRSTPGLWEATLGEYNIAINAHREELKSCDGMTVPPMRVLVNAPKYVGAFMLADPTGGIGSPGMEDDYLTALRADIERLEAPQPPDREGGAE